MIRTRSDFAPIAGIAIRTFADKLALVPVARALVLTRVRIARRQFAIGSVRPLGTVAHVARIVDATPAGVETGVHRTRRDLAIGA